MRRPKHITAKERTRAAFHRLIVRKVVNGVFAEVQRRIQAEFDRWRQEREDCINGIGPFPKPPFA